MAEKSEVWSTLVSHKILNFWINKERKITKLYKYKQCLNRHFTKEDIQVANTYVNRCSTSSVIWKIQIKTIVKYNFTPTRIQKANKKQDKRNKNITENTKCWWGCRTTGTHILWWWEHKIIQPVWKIGGLLKLNIWLSNDPEIPQLDVYQRENICAPKGL